MARELGDVLEAIFAGVVVIDREGRVEELNAAACRIVEHSREAVLGRPVEELITPGHAVARLGRLVLERGAPTAENQQRVERRTGASAEVDVAASPLIADGRTDGVVIVMRDRTATRRLEQLESERERFAAFGRIAAGVAHEVKNPLGGNRGAAELLLKRASDEKTQQTAELIVRESTRIASLIDDFMVFARGDRMTLAPLNVHRVIDHVIDLVAHEPLAAKCRFIRAFDPSIPELLADADRLTQVFLNLTRNALQAMEPDGGTLKISTGMTLDHRISLEKGRALPTLAVSFVDDGCGMDEETLRQVKTPFFTTRAGGTGLGMAVAEYWITQHLGSLHIESEPGRGTTVRVTLPLRRSP